MTAILFRPKMDLSRLSEECFTADSRWTRSLFLKEGSVDLPLGKHGWGRLCDFSLLSTPRRRIQYEAVALSHSEEEVLARGWISLPPCGQAISSFLPSFGGCAMSFVRADHCDQAFRKRTGRSGNQALSRSTQSHMDAWTMLVPLLALQRSGIPCIASGG